MSEKREFYGAFLDGVRCVRTLRSFTLSYRVAAIRPSLGSISPQLGTPFQPTDAIYRDKFVHDSVPKYVLWKLNREILSSRICMFCLSGNIVFVSAAPEP